jgi:hypothetical protein
LDMYGLDIPSLMHFRHEGAAEIGYFNPKRVIH